MISNENILHYNPVHYFLHRSLGNTPATVHSLGQLSHFPASSSPIASVSSASRFPTLCSYTIPCNSVTCATHWSLLNLHDSVFTNVCFLLKQIRKKYYITSCHYDYRAILSIPYAVKGKPKGLFLL